MYHNDVVRTALGNVLLFALPLIVLNFGISPFEPVKVVIAETCIYIFLVATVIQTYRSKKFYVNKTLSVISLCIFILSLWHILNSSGAFFGNSFRLQGIFLLWSLLLWGILSTSIFMSVKNMHLAIPAIFILFFITVAEKINRYPRVGASLGEPNALAATILFLWPVAFFAECAKGWRKIIVRGVVLAMAVCVLFFTHSRSGAIGFFIQILFFVTQYIFKMPLKKSVLICVLVILFSYTLPFLDTARVWESRVAIWGTAFEAGSASMFLGGGFGSIERRIHQTAQPYANAVYYQYIDSAHNIFLDWWVQGGVTGLVLFVSLIYFTIKNLIEREEVVKISLVLGIILALSFNPGSVTSLVALWWLIGQAFVPYNCNSRIIVAGYVYVFT